MYDEEERVTPYPLRMEPELREALEIRAKANDRPLSQEILSILKKHIKQPDTLKAIEGRLKVIENNQADILRSISNPSN